MSTSSVRGPKRTVRTRPAAVSAAAAPHPRKSPWVPLGYPSDRTRLQAVKGGATRALFPDDPSNVWAFNARANPLGARLNAIFSSDIGHFDVPDMTEVQDMFSRIWENLVARPAGPLALRFLMQPLMAAIFGIRDGIKDAAALVRDEVDPLDDLRGSAAYKR